MTAFRAWQNAESALVKKKEAEANYTAKNRVEKLDQAAREVAEAEEHVTETHKAFDKLSTQLKKELKRFDVVRVSAEGDL
jgi:sorting nexin-1/2